MNEFENEYCLKIMRKIESQPVTRPFLERLERPVPTKDKKTNEKKLTFSNIKFNLNNGMFNKAEWIKEMRTFFQNVANEYRDDSVICLIAKDFSNWFEKKVKYFPRNAEEEWLMKYEKVQQEAKFILENSPLKSV